MRSDPDWTEDLARYPGSRPFLKEHSLWSVWVYRFGRRVERRAPGLRKRLLTSSYWLMYRITQTMTGITLPRSATVGAGLRIWHFGNIVIHPDAVIGARCTLRHGVTIGNRVDDGPVPVIGDDVDLGAYAQILGGVRVGHRARIGAMAVVLRDVPDDASAVGNPARIVSRLRHPDPEPHEGAGVP